MALKFEIENLDGVDDSIKGLYEKDGDKYRLSVEGVDDGAELKRAKEHEKNARKAAEERVRELTEQIAEKERKIEESQSKKAKESGDIEALESSWKEKLTRREAELQQQIQGLSGNLNTLLVDKEAATIAASMAVENCAPTLERLIKDRLGVSEKDGRMVTVVKGLDGKPSALTIDELKQEFSSNPAYAPLIVGSKASGSGASGGSGGGAASSKSWSELKTTKERVAHIKQKTG